MIMKPQQDRPRKRKTPWEKWVVISAVVVISILSGRLLGIGDSGWISTLIGITVGLEASALYMLRIEPKLHDPHKGKYNQILQAWCIERFSSMENKPPTLEFSAQEVEAIRQRKVLRSLAIKYVAILASIDKTGQARIWGYDPEEALKQIKLMDDYYRKPKLLAIFADIIEDSSPRASEQNGALNPREV